MSLQLQRWCCNQWKILRSPPWRPYPNCNLHCWWIQRICCWCSIQWICSTRPCLQARSCLQARPSIQTRPSIQARPSSLPWLNNSPLVFVLYQFFLLFIWNEHKIILLHIKLTVFHYLRSYPLGPYGAPANTRLHAQLAQKSWMVSNCRCSLYIVKKLRNVKTSAHIEGQFLAWICI